MRTFRPALGLAVLALGAWAQIPYETQGAPPRPKVDIPWNRYRTSEEIASVLKRLAEAHPEITTLHTIGQSVEGRDLLVLEIMNSKTGSAETKAGFWVDGGIHANELQGPEVALYCAWFLCENYGRIDAITRLVDERVFYVMPVLSPDSRDAHMAEPNTTHSPRTGQLPVDDDRDGQTDEDGPDDLNGDGHITQMRRKDPFGNMRPSREFPGQMEPVGPGERGEYTMLGSEGIDNDGDGRINEDGDGSYDPNRDWPWAWQPGSIQHGAHHYPLSLPENRALADFVMARPHMAGAQSFHNSGGMILRGPGAKGERMDRSDLQIYDWLGKRGEAILPGYRYLDIAEGLYEVFGGEIDWFYAMQGALTFTNELFTPFNYFRKEEADGGFFGSQEQARHFDKYLLFSDGYVPWTEVDHPVYGKIEVGGAKKNWGRQPPSFLLEEECHRNAAFVYLHADAMPRLRVDHVSVETLGDGLVAVTAAIANDKPMPSRLAVDIKNGISPPDRVSLKGADEVFLGLWSAEPKFLTPSIERRPGATVRVPSVPGMGVRYVRWIVRGEGPFEVELRSTKGGWARGAAAEK